MSASKPVSTATELFTANPAVSNSVSPIVLAVVSVPGFFPRSLLRDLQKPAAWHVQMIESIIPETDRRLQNGDGSDTIMPPDEQDLDIDLLVAVGNVVEWSWRLKSFQGALFAFPNFSDLLFLVSNITADPFASVHPKATPTSDGVLWVVNKKTGRFVPFDLEAAADQGPVGGYSMTSVVAQLADLEGGLEGKPDSKDIKHPTFVHVN